MTDIALARGAREVAGAGRMIVREGRLVQITNESPAYHPSFAQMHDLVKRLTGLGVDLTGDGGGVVVIVYAAIETRMGLAKGKRATE